MERLDKVLSNLGYGTRKEIKQVVKKGFVTVNDEKVKDSGLQIDPEKDTIVINGEKVEYKKYIYLMMNKPAGVISATYDKRDETVIDLLYMEDQVFEPFPVGRLDKDTVGLLLLTNDGDIVNKILRAGNNHEKEYMVTVNKAITDDFIKKMSSGVRILGTVTKKCFVKKEGSKVFRIILTEGMNRQIRRMCEVFGYKVVKLERVRIMNIHLGNLKNGNWRDLTIKELEGINDLIKDSQKVYKE